MDDLVLSLIQNMGYRAMVSALNRILHLEGKKAVKTMTLRDRTEDIGTRLSASLNEKAGEILKEFRISADAGSMPSPADLPDSVTHPDLPKPMAEERILGVSARFNSGRDGMFQMKDMDMMRKTEASPDGCVYVSVDEVGVKHQKASRAEGYVKDRVYVQNTVIHVQVGGRTHMLTALGMKDAMLQLPAFLLHNHLLERHRLIFLSDGAANIRESIASYFSFREYTLILDWFHLRKKCLEFLSMGVKGAKDEKAEIRRTLLRILWAGNVQDAKGYIAGLKDKNIKNREILTKLSEYLDNKSPNITCYALRAMMKLRNSSNMVEKANDLVVARRQKHHGMSWSFEGSGALAAITATSRNGGLSRWLRTGEVSYDMAA